MAWRMRLADLAWGKGSNQVHAKVGGMAPVSKSHNSVLSPEPQISVSPHVTLVCSTFPPLLSRVSGYKWDLCTGLLRGCPCLSKPCLSLADRIPADFHSQLLYGYLCSVLVCWTGSLAWNWDPSPIFKGSLCSCDIPLESQPLDVGARPALFATLLFLPFFSMCLLCKSLDIRLLFC